MGVQPQKSGLGKAESGVEVGITVGICNFYTTKQGATNQRNPLFLLFGDPTGNRTLVSGARGAYPGISAEQKIIIFQ